MILRGISSGTSTISVDMPQPRLFIRSAKRGQVEFNLRGISSGTSTISVDMPQPRLFIRSAKRGWMEFNFTRILSISSGTSTISADMPQPQIFIRSATKRGQVEFTFMWHFVRDVQYKLKQGILHPRLCIRSAKKRSGRVQFYAAFHLERPI